MSEASQLANILAKVPWLAALEASLREKLACQFTEHFYTKDRQLFLQGDPGDALFLVRDGKLRIVIENPDGREVTLAIRGPGSFVGDMALIDGQPRSASAYAACDCRCLVLLRRDFDLLLDQHPEATRSLLVFLSLRLREASAQIESLATKTIRQRLAATLAQAALQGGERLVDGYLLPSSVDYRHLVGLLCTSREPVSRAARSLIESGLIARVHRRFKVLDLAGLHSLAHVPSE